ncbi:phage tail sheath family protein [Pseudothauera nasutitermitis]|uniref:Phage tail sheath family protein n=1 Tax=Pseudothauera nasutitermitis TaxID=2565930 RepID=A0A4S4B1R3_9RHOO|nr:phage tail sheath C-terminal domain-containing protein [Pseudothauera nasutitermitis]THF66399.1 phage tail sheath family protein [Pseudothauera nasutitermitis]
MTPPGACKTPGVYILEKDDFPTSAAAVDTAVPAFIGYTEKADSQGKSLRNRPYRISSLAEYRECFGGAPLPRFEIRRKAADSAGRTVFSHLGEDYCLHRVSVGHLLYYSMCLFFANGGGPCYVVSVGDYREGVELQALEGGLAPLRQEGEPMLVAVPDAVLLNDQECAALQRAVLAFCGGHAPKRFAILDVPAEHENGFDPERDAIRNFRDAIGTEHLGHGAAYYPWLHTSAVESKDFGLHNIENAELLLTRVEEELGIPREQLDERQMRAMSRVFRTVVEDIVERLNLLPPSGAMAGIYAQVDCTEGVWKAPANVPVSMARIPAVMLSSQEQDGMSVSLDGKSINAIRFFDGVGTLVWGARTLDGNSLDWRYVNVRRTAIMLEESIRLACKAYVFEPNTASTWVTVRSMVSNFLIGIWKAGGLAGAVPSDAFSVRVGLGETMTPEDILEGTLRVSVLVALRWPAEFIEIALQQQMESS